ncbi:hypothetical protein ACFOW9_10645, partial [Arthrobacter cryoconiti]
AATRRCLTRKNKTNCPRSLTHLMLPDGKTDAKPAQALAAGKKPALEPFKSILFDRCDGPITDAGNEQSVALVDLQLNQIIAAVIAGREQYDLEPFFLSPLRTLEQVTYRHAVLADLNLEGIRTAIDGFARSLSDMRKHLKQAQTLRYPYQRMAVFVLALEKYCSAVEELRRALDDADPGSSGVLGFREYADEYVDSHAFHTLATAARGVLTGLANIQYCFRIKGSKVTVSRYTSEPDQAQEVQDTFERFQQGILTNPVKNGRMIVDMDHVEALILDRVARLFPDAFGALDSCYQEHQGFADGVMIRFDREVQFYLAYLDHIAALEGVGVHFCIPTVTTSKCLAVENTFDLALAEVLAAKHRPVVTNDFWLRDPERIFVVSGPNQGGKTTFARTVGQLHYLAALGLPVAGTRAELFLPDKIFTHFERGENLVDLRGKLMDDLVRIHNILEDVTPDSLVILNEIFTSTTLADAIDLGGKILHQIASLGPVCVCVTFVDELSCLNEATVSMVSAVAAEDPSRRTFKVLRKKADGLAHALVLAQKYRLTHDQLMERISS